MNEAQRINCRSRMMYGNCLRAELTDNQAMECAQQTIKQLTSDNETARSALKGLPGLIAENNQLQEENDKLQQRYDQLKQDHCGALERSMEANMSCLRAGAEISVYRDALDEIRDLCEEESPAMATLGELAEIADLALNDRWGADELLYRVQKLEAVAAAAKKWASIRQGYGHGHRIGEYADTLKHEKVMSYLRLAGDDIEAALAVLDTDGGGK